MKRKRRTSRVGREGSEPTSVPLLKANGPGLLGYLLPVRRDLGLHDVNTSRSNMVRLLAGDRSILDDTPEEQRPGPALDPIANDEREALLLSLATTICRAEYHERRFSAIAQHLAERRLAVASPIFYDAIVPSAMFEGAAALGAARTTVDEIIHVAARRKGERRWEVSDVIKDGNP